MVHRPLRWLLILTSLLITVGGLGLGVLGMLALTLVVGAPLPWWAWGIGLAVGLGATWQL